MPKQRPVKRGVQERRPQSSPRVQAEQPILETVLRLRSLDLCLIPMADRGKTPPSRFNRRKYHKERPRERELRRWFPKYKNVALVTGPVSGHVCGRDFESGEAYHRWAVTFPRLARSLPTIRTSRGFCVLFRTDGRDPALARRAEIKQPDGELKVHSSLITLPPSIHPSGIRYRWEREPIHDGFPLVPDVVEAGLLVP